MSEVGTTSGTDADGGSGKRRRKVRIRYKERVRITERPKGYKFRRFVRRNRFMTTLLILLSVVGIAVAVVGPDNVLTWLHGHYTDLQRWYFGWD